MARTPDPAPSPVSARRSGKPKAAGTPAGLPIAGGSDATTVETAGVDAVTDAFVGQPTPGRQGRPPKQRAEAAISSGFEADAVKRPVADVDALEAAVGPPSPGDDALIAEMAYPVSAAEGSDTPSSSGGSDDGVAAPQPGLDAAAPAKPAAQWERATGAVRFDWAEIERAASHEGPNQAMAKLLVAARAEGANSRWPF